MTRKEIFYAHLTPFLEKESFKLKRNDFVKEVNKDVLKITFDIWPDFSQIEPSYRILINDVEQVKKKALGKRYYRHISAGHNRYVVSGRKHEESDLDTETEKLALESAEREIIFYMSTVKDYFRDYSDVVFLDDILNTVPGSKLDAAFNEVDTSFLAIIVAYLCRRKTLKELIPVYREKVELGNKYHNRLPDFDLLAEYVTTQ
jgi:hypothetical protein